MARFNNNIEISNAADKFNLALFGNLFLMRNFPIKAYQKAKEIIYNVQDNIISNLKESNFEIKNLIENFYKKILFNKKDIINNIKSAFNSIGEFIKDNKSPMKSFFEKKTSVAVFAILSLYNIYDSINQFKVIQKETKNIEEHILIIEKN